MKVLGIIAEFNPFHNGHAHLLSVARKQFGADHLIIVLSGDHVQRGAPAIVGKYTRTRIALKAGADLVLELPVPFATGSAQYFARSAVATLLHTGVVNGLLFGSECGDITTLKEDTAIPVPSGSSMHDGHPVFPENRRTPNDLLGAEYLNALAFFHSDLDVYTIPRIGADHHAASPVDAYASATFLRSCLLSASGEEDFSTSECTGSVEEYLPPYAGSELRSWCKSHRFLSLQDYSDLIWYSLLQNRSCGYSSFFDVYDDLSHKILDRFESYTDITGFLEQLKSKDITYSHLSRALLHILLGIRKEQVSVLTDTFCYCPWLRILGLRKDASALLHSMKQHTDVPLLTKLADAGKRLSPEAAWLLSQDLFASALYNKCAAPATASVSEYRHGIVTL